MKRKKHDSIFKRILFYVFPKISWRKTLLSSLHSLWLIAATLLWLGYVNVMDGFGFMNDYLNMRSFVNEYILNKEPELNFTDRYLLLNTSRNNALVPFDNDNTINSVITDRRVLAQKLKILDDNSEKIKFVICDVYFEMLSADAQADSMLQVSISSLSRKNKFVMPGFYNDQENKFIKPVFEGVIGSSQYRSSFLNMQFLKYSLINYNQYRQIPLIAFEAVTGKKIEKRKLGFLNYYSYNGGWVLNTFIPEFRYSQSNLSEGVNYFQLGLFDDYFIREGQVVLIGDFEGRTDVHQSIAGLSAGPFILMNVYDSLVEGDNVIRLNYLVLLFIVFFYVSFTVFFNKTKLPESKNRIHEILNYIVNQRVYFILLALVYVSMLFFHHYIHILILLSYFGLIDILEQYVFSKKGKN